MLHLHQLQVEIVDMLGASVAQKHFSARSPGVYAGLQLLHNVYRSSRVHARTRNTHIERLFSVTLQL